MQKHRIHTNIGSDQRINVEINQNFDVMEVLSLKFSQQDIYDTSNCSDYGVVVGRVFVNNGFGVPNAKVSIFIPLSDIDENDPVISKLYPYKNVTDIDENNYRYNLLPSRKQHGGHEPTGTFFDQLDILTREECLEVFEKYYKYTVKTNSAGDFMIWGVPVGSQTLHIDIDLSDIGCFSLRPYDFLKKGVGVDDFERFYKFKSSTDIDGLPQILTYDQTINVYPLWGNEDLCEIGISRSDFNLSQKGIVIEPASLILISSLTDDNGDAVKKNGKIRKKSGYKCNLQTSEGTIECVRYTRNKVLGSDGVTQYPELEFFTPTEDIDENGVAMVVLPMNLDYVITNEFGEQEITNDTNKGIPTNTIARFRIGLNFDSPKTTVAKYLVPNIREFNPNVKLSTNDIWRTGHNNNNEYNEGMLTSYQFSDVFEDYIKIPISENYITNSTNYYDLDKKHKSDLMLGLIKGDGVPEDYFYKFTYGKVYTVSSFHGMYNDTTKRDAFLGIKQIRPSEEDDCNNSANYIPTNFAFRNRISFKLLLAQITLFIQYIYTIILIKFSEYLGFAINSIGEKLKNVGFDIGNKLFSFSWHPFNELSEKFRNLAYKIQERFTQELPLTIYPDCDECSSDEDSITNDDSYTNEYCRVGEIMLNVDHSDTEVYLIIEHSNKNYNFRNSITGVTFLEKEFPGETPRDNGGLCSTTDMLYYEDLFGLKYEETTIDTLTKPRFYGNVFSHNSIDISGTTSFNYFRGNFNTFSTDDFTISITPMAQFMGFEEFSGMTLTNRTYTQCYAIKFSYKSWYYLTGIQYGITENPIYDSLSKAVIRIYDQSVVKYENDEVTNLTIEDGCKKYDKIYNENIVRGYLISNHDIIYNKSTPDNPPYDFELEGIIESETVLEGYNVISTIIGKSDSVRMPIKVDWSEIGDETYDRKTKSGLTEFRDGVFTVIPVINGGSNNNLALLEWYKRKRIALHFCGGAINYSFVNNWLHGVLYFFKFNKRLKWNNKNNYDLNQRGSKFPRDLIFFNILDENYYYRSTPYNMDLGFIGQYRGETKEILHPTTFYDIGVRDEFLYEICNDPSIDPTCSVVRDLTNSSYQDPGNIVEYGLNYRQDTVKKYNLDDFFNHSQYGSNIRVFDGDIIQLMSINCESGIESFDLDSPHYFNYNSELMDPEDPKYSLYFKPKGVYGPTPIDFKLDENGKFIRLCLNNRLGDFTQEVPFYLWDKGDVGFGENDSQTWATNNITSMKLQRIYSKEVENGSTTNFIMKDGEEEYLLSPMTIDHPTYNITGNYEDSIERFDVISLNTPSGVENYIEGDIWLKVTSGSTINPLIGDVYVVVGSTWVLQPIEYISGSEEIFITQTVLNYRGNKQVLSTPFLFYFGLRPEKTSFDILIKYFGPKGAFPSTD